MNNSVKIINVLGREILNSRGKPTVEAEVVVEGGIMGRASVPSGKTVGIREAVELLDGDLNRYNGCGVQKAITNINEYISKKIVGKNVFDQISIDKMLIELDGTETKESLGANAIMSVSLAVAKAASNVMKIPLYKYIGGKETKILPLPMMNILNGGAHVKNNTIEIAENMIVPVGAKSYKEALRWCSEVFFEMKNILEEKGLPSTVGDEGGFAPSLSSDEEVFDMILFAIKKAGFIPGKDIKIAFDAAASGWFNAKEDKYILTKSGKKLSRQELVNHWINIYEKYPIFSMEDCMGEDDWEGWQLLTEKLGNKIQLVGDDLFTTNPKYLKKGINEKCANSILIKINQIGTLTETLNTIEIAKKHGYTTVISQRSGETEDTAIADLAVATNAGQIKAGGLCKTDRVCKYNQLLRIEEDLGRKAVFWNE